MTRGYKQMVVSGLLAALLGGCQVVQTSITPAQETQIRGAVKGFALAVRSGDSRKLQDRSVIASENRALGQAVIDDTAANRKIQVKLAEEFDYREARPSAVGSDAYIQRMETTAREGPIAREGDRACVGLPGMDGSVYLRQVHGQWKVELIPTMVMEAGGHSTINDPVVDYRFGVSKTLNTWMLERLEGNEFMTKAEFDAARNNFWMHFLTYTAAGKDPHDTMMSALPRIPRDEAIVNDQ